MPDQTFDLPSAQRFVARLALPDATMAADGIDLHFDQAKKQALLVGSDVQSFDIGVEAEFREAVTASGLLAQLATDKLLGSNADPIAYFDAYFGFLGRLGWVTQVRDTAEYQIKVDGAKVHEAVIEIVTAFTGNAPGVAALVALTLKQLKTMDADSPLITLFSKHSEHAAIGRFQFTSVRQDASGGLFAEVMAFGLNAERKITKVLFFELDKTRTRLRRSLGSLSLNRTAIQGLLPSIRAKVQSHLAANVAAIDIDS